MANKKIDAPAVIQKYTDAHRLANPGSPDPQLTYDRGWFILRYAGSSLSDKFRGYQISHFALVLRNRARLRDMKQAQELTPTDTRGRED